MQNGNKPLLDFLRIEKIGKLLKLLYITVSAVTVTTPSDAFILITRRNKYVLKDTV